MINGERKSWDRVLRFWIYTNNMTLFKRPDSGLSWTHACREDYEIKLHLDQKSLKNQSAWNAVFNPTVHVH